MFPGITYRSRYGTLVPGAHWAGVRIVGNWVDATGRFTFAAVPASEVTAA